MPDLRCRPRRMYTPSVGRVQFARTATAATIVRWASTGCAAGRSAPTCGQLLVRPSVAEAAAAASGSHLGRWLLASPTPRRSHRWVGRRRDGWKLPNGDEMLITADDLIALSAGIW